LPGSCRDDRQASGFIWEDWFVSRTVALVLILAVGLPALAFAAAVSAAGASEALISGGLSFFVVVAAVIAMLFEIKRLADQDAST
jgi:hypothetical protein